MDCGDAFAKILLFVFNLVVFLCGIAVIVLGTILITSSDNNYVSIIGYEEWNICIAMIVVGCVVTVVSFFGCCGAIKENTCMLYTFSALLAIIFVAELAAVIVAFIYQGDIENNVKTEMMENMPTCNGGDTDSDLCDEWFNMQEDLKCCGANNSGDWTDLWTGSGDLPPSCCPQGEPSCTTATSYTGCVDKVVDEISPYVWAIAGVELGIAVLQVTLIAFACCLITAIKKSIRKQEYQSVPLR